MSIELDKLKKEKTNSITGQSVNDLFQRLNSIEINFSSTFFSDKKKERLFSELGILLSSGIDIKTSLEIIVDQQNNEKDQLILKKIYDRVLNGDSFSKALEYSEKFDPYDYFSITIGEETGRVSDVLNDLTNFYSKKVKQKRQLINAFSYPALVLITAFAAVFFMLNFMVPMFVDIFKRANTQLPKLTQIIVKASEIFTSNILYFFILLIIGITVVYSIRKKNYYRSFSANVTLKIPLIGKIIKMMYLTKFFQSMALLIGSKVTMLRAIQLIRNMILFYPFEQALLKIEDDIMHGISLHKSMEQFSIFDKRIVSLVKVGEEVNQLDKIFDKLNKQYSDELEHQISLMGSLLEPILIIFIGILVAIILIAMYLPMFQMGSTIH